MNISNKFTLLFVAIATFFNIKAQAAEEKVSIISNIGYSLIDFKLSPESDLGELGGVNTFGNLGFKGLYTFNNGFTIGGGLRYVTGNGSFEAIKDNYQIKHSYSSLDIGFDVGFNFNPINKLNIFTLINYYVSPYTNMEYNVTTKVKTYNQKIDVYSNSKIGADIDFLYQINKEIGVGIGGYIGYGFISAETVKIFENSYLFTINSNSNYIDASANLIFLYSI